MTTRSPVYSALAAAVLFLVLVPLGTSVFVLGFIEGDSPCILCWAQRIGMALIALIGLFILRYGPRPRYLGLAFLVAAYGAYMGLRHSSLHLVRDIGQGFAVSMLGAHTYVWSYVVFMVCIIVMAVLLMNVPPRDFQADSTPADFSAAGRASVLAFLVVTAGTIVQAFASTGPPPYFGQGDPVRFSFNPRHWVWSFAEAEGAASIRGRWAVDEPDVAAVDPSPATAPLPGLQPLAIVEQRQLTLPLRGTPTDLAYDAATDRFLLTTQNGVYLTDGALSSIAKYTVVDPLFSVDLGPFCGAGFVDSQTVLAVTQNKSFVKLKESGTANPEANYRFFLESPAAFDEVARSRFATIRARLMYVMAAAVDPATHDVYTVTVPNVKSKRWVVSRFDGGDMQLSAEFMPKQDGVYVTAATIAGGRMYALSAAHSMLLTLDLASGTITGARTIPGLSQPTGIAIKGGTFYIVSRSGALTIVRQP